MKEMQMQKASSRTPHFLVHALFATGRNGEMGNADGTLPWRTKDNNIRQDLPDSVKKQCTEDMALFKNLTTGNIILMGYNTFKTFSFPLPGRINIVIDRTAEESSVISEKQWNFFKTLEGAMNACEKLNSKKQEKNRQVYIVGGAKLLSEAFNKELITGKIYHTIIDYDFPESTVFFNLPQNP